MVGGEEQQAFINCKLEGCMTAIIDEIPKESFKIVKEETKGRDKADDSLSSDDDNMNDDDSVFSEDKQKGE